MAQLQIQLRQDALVDRLMPDPQGPVNFLKLEGLLGRSPEPGYEWRIYADDFRSYLDIKEEDIIHAQQLPPEDPSGGRTKLYVRMPVMSGLNDFLKGPLGMLAVRRATLPRTEDMLIGSFIFCPPRLANF